MGASSLRRRGFTLVELLAVIAIIGLLAALLLPAVQAAREAARRTTCGNNICQIGIALQSHSSLIGTLPAAASHPLGSQGGLFPWTVAILPFLEQKSTYDRLVAGNSWNYSAASGLQPIVEAANPSFICPSCSVGLLNPSVVWRGQIGWLPDFRSSKSNYLGNGGPQTMWSGAGCPNPLTDRELTNIVENSRGAIRKLRGLPVSSITDGLSNTFLVGEAGGASASTMAPGLWATAYQQNDHTASAQRYGANKLNSGAFGSFGSLHPGGANFVMCDGSVRFVSDFISHNAPPPFTSLYEFCPGSPSVVNLIRNPGYGVYQYLSNRDDRQAISGDSF